MDPFLAALGWDVFNEKQAPQHLREVVHEDTVEITDNDEALAKRPDYALRLGAERKFFLEAKRPSVPITTSNASAFQVRRYGWNARLPISVLSNFDKLVIYDCRVRPKAEDDVRVARLHVYDYTEYVSEFDEIYALISREKVLEDVPAQSIVAHWQQHHTRALPNLQTNIQCGNSLLDSGYFDHDQDALTDAERFAQLNPLDWEEAFPAVFAAGGFDAIVGNPPYVRIQKMVGYSPREVQYYQGDQSPYACAKSGNFDKYILFIERGLSLLKAAGRLGYIIPHKFFVLESGKALRKLLSEGQHLARIVHFGVQQVFGRKSTTYTCILILARQATPAFAVEHVGGLLAWRRGEPGEIVQYEAAELDAAPWEFVSPAARRVFERLRTAHPTTLEQVAKIFVGLQTSKDRIYIIEPVDDTKEIVSFTDPEKTTWSIEKAILRPCLKKVTLPAFGHPEPNTYIIFPYRITEGRAKPYTPAEMQDRFPKCWTYLNAHKAVLQQRNMQSGPPDAWYRYGRNQSLTKFDGAPKLVWSVITREGRYAYDDRGILFTGGGNGPYYGLRPLPDTALSIHYLQAVLSHPVIDAMVRARASAFRGDYKSHGKQSVKDLPIRQIDFADATEKAAHDEIVRLVETLIRTREQAATAAVPSQRQQASQQARKLSQAVQERVSELYGVTEADLAAIGASTIVATGDDETQESDAT